MKIFLQAIKAFLLCGIDLHKVYSSESKVQSW